MEKIVIWIHERICAELGPKVYALFFWKLSTPLLYISSVDDNYGYMHNLVHLLV